MLEFFVTTWYGGLFLMIICSIIIAKACDFFEASTEYLGRNLTEGVKGATLNAIGSSIPELLTTVFFLAFAVHGNLGRDLAASVGGDTGSAIFNSVIIPALVLIVVFIMYVSKVKLSKKVILRDGLFLIGAEILLLVLLSSDYITHWHGWIFTGFYLIYLGYMFISMKKNKDKQESLFEKNSWYEKYIHKKPEKKKTRAISLLIFSILIISLGCAGLVESCKGIAESMGINPLFIALILVAAASSVPDTIISLKDAKKGNYDDSLSNVLGSNIFDITISMGLPLALFLLITNQKINFVTAGATLIDIRIVLLIITAVTIGIYYFSKFLKKKHVFILLAIYVVFIIYSLGAAANHAGSESLIANISGGFIDFLNKPGGIEEFLRNIANTLTGSW